MNRSTSCSTQLDLNTRAGQVLHVEPPASLALEEMLEGSPARETARTTDTSVLLTLTSEECLQLLVDNRSVARSFRTVLEIHSSRRGHVLKGTGSDALAELAAGGLLPIERVLVLRLIPSLHCATSDDLLRLAAVTQEVKLIPDTVLFKEEDPAALYALVAGEISLEPDASGVRPQRGR